MKSVMCLQVLQETALQGWKWPKRKKQGFKGVMSESTEARKPHCIPDLN